MRSTYSLSARLFAAFVCTLACLLLLGARSAQACDPYQASCQTIQAPDPPFSGQLDFLISSSGCGDPTHPNGVRFCQDAILLNPSTTIAQKCNAIVAQINNPGSGCNLDNFVADGSACGTTGTFTITDNTCEGSTPFGAGISLLIGNSLSSLGSGGFLPDYENDIITNGCQGTNGAGMAMLAGSPSGMAINGNAASVGFIVATPDRGIGSVSVSTVGKTPAAIVNEAVTNANLDLTAIGSAVRCSVDQGSGAVVTCATRSQVTSPVNAAGATLSVPCNFQLNDTGLKHFVMSGPAQDVQVARQVIAQQGGIPSLKTFNFVAPVVKRVPTLGTWMTAALATLLGTIALVFLAMRRRTAAGSVE
jgi:hypothetical protein